MQCRVVLTSSSRPAAVQPTLSPLPLPLSARLQPGCGPILSNLPQRLPEPRRIGRRLARIRPQKAQNLSTRLLVLAVLGGSVAICGSLWAPSNLMHGKRLDLRLPRAAPTQRTRTSDCQQLIILTTNRSSNDRLSATVQFPNSHPSLTTLASSSLIGSSGNTSAMPEN